MTVMMKTTVSTTVDHCHLPRSRNNLLEGRTKESFPQLDWGGGGGAGFERGKYNLATKLSSMFHFPENFGFNILNQIRKIFFTYVLTSISKEYRLWTCVAKFNNFYE